MLSFLSGKGWENLLKWQFQEWIFILLFNSNIHSSLAITPQEDYLTLRLGCGLEESSLKILGGVHLELQKGEIHFL